MATTAPSLVDDARAAASSMSAEPRVSGDRSDTRGAEARAPDDTDTPQELKKGEREQPPAASEGVQPPAQKKIGVVLSVAVVKRICCLLDEPADVVRASRVCRRWHTAAMSEDVWCCLGLARGWTACDVAALSGTPYVCSGAPWPCNDARHEVEELQEKEAANGDDQSWLVASRGPWQRCVVRWPGWLAAWPTVVLAHDMDMKVTEQEGLRRTCAGLGLDLRFCRRPEHLQQLLSADCEDQPLSSAPQFRLLLFVLGKGEQAAMDPWVRQLRAGWPGASMSELPLTGLRCAVGVFENAKASEGATKSIQSDLQFQGIDVLSVGGIANSDTVEAWVVRQLRGLRRVLHWDRHLIDSDKVLPLAASIALQTRALQLRCDDWGVSEEAKKAAQRQQGATGGSTTGRLRQWLVARTAPLVTRASEFLGEDPSEMTLLAFLFALVTVLFSVLFASLSDMFGGNHGPSPTNARYQPR